MIIKYYMEYIDVHAHTYELKDEEEVLRKCGEQGIAVINNGTNQESNDKILKRNTLKAMGWWPGEKSEFEIISKQAGTKEIVAIGEIGLDFYHKIPVKKQTEQFKKMLDLAVELKKPVIVHSRKAETSVFEILKKYDLKVVMHSFTGRKTLIKEGTERGYFFSVPTIILKSSNFQKLAEIVPITQMLTETDTPYLGIESPNTPLTIPLIVEKISEIKGCDEKKVLLRNAVNLFRL